MVVFLAGMALAGKLRRVRCLWLAAGLGVALLAAPAPAQAEVRPFGTLDCVPAQGVRFCEGSIATRVKSFDGVPLDVNVTLPARSRRNLPLVIQLHGWGGRKTGLEDSRQWAEQGYIVLNYTARGFGDSCGSQQSREADPQGCEKGWIHLADSRYEVRDSQYLAGLLADQRLVHPRRIGATGVSYGGGQSLQLATLRDRVRLEDGSYVRWLSPRRRLSMTIAAAVPLIPWSDLVYALVPNGRTLDYVVAGETDALSPFGVMKESYISGLFALGEATGFYAPPGADPSADIRTWYALIQSGEPYEEGVLGPVAEEVARNHSAYYLDATTPAPILISNGFTDDLVPANEAVRYANRYPGATIAQLHFDWGHARGQNKAADTALLNARLHDWFDYYVKGDGRATPLAGVEALTQACPASAPSGGPLHAPSWSALHPGEVRFNEAAAKTVTSTSDTLGSTVDPVAGGGACATTSAADQAGTATYRLPAVQGDGYTLVGSPTVIADLAVPADVGARNTELAARLWDVAPSGTQSLVARGVYRPDSSARVVFQLFPNAWHFEAGHVPKLELLGRDAPYLRPSNFPFAIGISNLELRLPTHDLPDGGVVETPAPPVTPAGATTAP